MSLAEWDLKPHHSADVRLYLIVGDVRYKLAKMGPGYVIPRQPLSLDPCDAEILISVDGRERWKKVRLTDGAVPFETTTWFEPLDDESR